MILFDITITGKLPKLLGIDPALSDLEEEEILIETFFHYFKTDIERFKDQGGRIHWKSAILTKTIFYVKLTRSTYKFKINLTDIEGFSIGRGLTGRHITLYFNENNPPRFFKFQPRDITNWEEELSKVGLKEIKKSNQKMNRTENTSVQN